MGHRRGTPARVPVTDGERRRYPRFQGVGLMVIIAGKLLKVIDISANGMKVEKDCLIPTGPLNFTLYPSDGHKLDLNHGLQVRGVVVRQSGRTAGIRFEPASLAVVKLVVSLSA